MSTEEIYAKVKEILAEELNADEDLISMDTAVRADLTADESGLVDVLLDLEEAFDLDIPDSDFEDMETVGDIVEYVKNEMD
ncbi:acyl carrier protein [Dysosmobacter sp.]|uniref:acyl carrier protein n=1 Tax=Dysosmobacter sp. TaxID=2591382 RepID=UPI002A907757|nr:acyl carrier protein [Dysosmobacter sp.]MDY3281209.1 acyl carrier protein [Dysosmobacter sp.]